MVTEFKKKEGQMVYDIHPDKVKELDMKIRQKRNGRLPGNGPIDKIPRYDWINDPNGYRDEKGRRPYNRCYHCGYQYNMANGFTAFCNICQKAMNYLQGGILSHLEQRRTRVPDDKTPINAEGNILN